MPLSVVESDQVVLKCMQQSVSVVGRVLDARVAFIIRMMPPQLLSLLLRAISLHSLFSLPIPSFRLQQLHSMHNSLSLVQGWRGEFPMSHLQCHRIAQPISSILCHTMSVGRRRDQTASSWDGSRATTKVFEYTKGERGESEMWQTSEGDEEGG